MAAMCIDPPEQWQGSLILRPGHAAGGVFCDATNQELPKKLLRQTSLPARHHYGLQIAEGMVTFFESYERELERYWTKMLFLQLS